MTRWLVLACVLAAAPVAHADDDDADADRRTPFDRGRFSLSAGAGTTSAFGERHIAIGGSVGYFVLDGLALGLALQHQFGDPSISLVSPELRYVAQPLVGRSPVVPYVGVFYSHWFVGEPFLDIDAVGTRGGLLYVSGRLILGLGVAYERVVSECTMDCDLIYPDLTLAIAL
jgi:hypothetical protein